MKHERLIDDESVAKKSAKGSNNNHNSKSRSSAQRSSTTASKKQQPDVVSSSMSSSDVTPPAGVIRVLEAAVRAAAAFDDSRLATGTPPVPANPPPMPVPLIEPSELLVKGSTTTTTTTPQPSSTPAESSSRWADSHDNKAATPEASSSLPPVEWEAPLRSNDLYVDYPLQAIRILEEGDFQRLRSNPMEKARYRLMHRSIDGCYAVRFLPPAVLAGNSEKNSDEDDRKDKVSSSYDKALAAADFCWEVRLLWHFRMHKDHPNCSNLYGVHKRGIDSWLNDYWRHTFFLITDRIIETLDQRLETWIQQKQPQPFKKRVQWALDLLSALAFLHSYKPMPLIYFLTTDKIGFDAKKGGIMLCHFGQTRPSPCPQLPRSLHHTVALELQQEQEKHQLPSQSLSTPAPHVCKSMAPEILAVVQNEEELLQTPGATAPRAESPITCKADIYAFGIVLWELLSVRRPTFGDGGDLVVQVMDRHKRPPMSKKWKAIIRDLLHGCLHQEDVDRWSMAKIEAQLEHLHKEGDSDVPLHTDSTTAAADFFVQNNDPAESEPTDEQDAFKERNNKSAMPPKLPQRRRGSWSMRNDMRSGLVDDEDETTTQSDSVDQLVATETAKSLRKSKSSISANSGETDSGVSSRGDDSGVRKSKSDKSKSSKKKKGRRKSASNAAFLEQKKGFDPPRRRSGSNAQGLADPSDMKSNPLRRSRRKSGSNSAALSDREDLSESAGALDFVSKGTSKMRRRRSGSTKGGLSEREDLSDAASSDVDFVTKGTDKVRRGRSGSIKRGSSERGDLSESAAADVDFVTRGAPMRRRRSGSIKRGLSEREDLSESAAADVDFVTKGPPMRRRRSGSIKGGLSDREDLSESAGDLTLSPDQLKFESSALVKRLEQSPSKSKILDVDEGQSVVRSVADRSAVSRRSLMTRQSSRRRSHGSGSDALRQSIGSAAAAAQIAEATPMHLDPLRQSPHQRLSRRRVRSKSAGRKRIMNDDDETKEAETTQTLGNDESKANRGDEKRASRSNRQSFTRKLRSNSLSRLPLVPLDDDDDTDPVTTQANSDGSNPPINYGDDALFKVEHSAILNVNQDESQATEDPQNSSKKGGRGLFRLDSVKQMFRRSNRSVALVDDDDSQDGSQGVEQKD